MKDNSVILEIDKKTKAALMAKLDGLKSIDFNEGIAMFLFKVKALAQLRLTERGHIVTSRLKNSIYVQMPKQNKMNKVGASMGVENRKTYKYKGGTADATMTSVSLGPNEGAVGTNVEYAQVIEMGGPPHPITSKDGKTLSWLPKAAGQAWFTTKTKSTLRNYYKDKSGKNTLKRQRIFVKSVNHPGYEGDSFLYWASKNAQRDVAEYFKEIATKNLPKIKTMKFK